MTCRDGATDLGAYVLGALEPADRRRFEQHLHECSTCAAELEEFRRLLPLLDAVRPGDLDDTAVAPSPGLFDRVSAAAAADRSRGTLRRRLLVAAAVLAVAGAGGTTWALQPDEETRSVVADGVRMTVTTAEQDEGTALEVRVSGVPARTECTLVVVDGDGNRHQAGEWSVTYTGEASFAGWSDVELSDVEDVVLLGTEGNELVRVPL